MASSASQKSFTKKEDDQTCCHHLIWLDEKLYSFSNRRKLEALREIDPKMEGFTCKEECIDYIREKNDRNTISYIIFIISGSLSEKVIPEIQDFKYILTIFIYCKNASKYEHLKYRKLRAICTDPDELLDSIEMFIAKYNDITDFSVFHNQYSTHLDSMSSKDKSKDECIIRNLKADEASFLWFNQMHKFMITLENDDDEKAKEEMIECCREQYKEESKKRSRIDEFYKESLNDNKEKAIHWYTENSFIHKCTNTVLRKENISQVYSYRYIIKLLCRQLKELHKQFIEEYIKREKKTSLRLYRGQYLKSEQIRLLHRNINNLISLNGFVSTTRDKDIAINFIKNRLNEDFEPVLLKIDIDMESEHSVAFADISKFSRYPEEKEVLLSIGSIFRIKSVDFDDQQQLYIIHLVLSQDNQLTVIKYIEQTYARSVDSADQSVLFGKLLFDMGECESAIKYFLDALNRLSDNNNQMRATYLNNIGVCYNELGKKDEALKYYRNALKIYARTDNKRGLGACQHNIASIYHAQKNHQEAFRWALEAFDIRQQNKIERASTLDLLGCIQLALHNVDAALDNFEEALQLRLKYLDKINPYHPDIGISYQNLGKVNSKLSKHTDAQTNYSQAAQIYRHNYPQSHPLVIEITKCLKETQ